MPSGRVVDLKSSPQQIDDDLQTTLSTLVIFPHIKQDVVSYGITRYVELTTVWGASVRFRSVIRHTLPLIISIHARCWRSGGDAMMGTLSLTVSTFSTVCRSLLRSFYTLGNWMSSNKYWPLNTTLTDFTVFTGALTRYSLGKGSYTTTIMSVIVFKTQWHSTQIII